MIFGTIGGTQAFAAAVLITACASCLSAPPEWGLDEDGNQVDCVLPAIQTKGRSIEWFLGKVSLLAKLEFTERDVEVVYHRRILDVATNVFCDVVSDGSLCSLGNLDPADVRTLGNLRNHFSGGRLQDALKFLNAQSGLCHIEDTYSSSKLLILHIAPPEQMLPTWERRVYRVGSSHKLFAGALPRRHARTGASAAYDQDSAVLSLISSISDPFFAWLDNEGVGRGQVVARGSIWNFVGKYHRRCGWLGDSRAGVTDSADSGDDFQTDDVE
jgi:hypothetical protein